MFIYSHHITPTKSKCQLSQLINQINRIESKKIQKKNTKSNINQVIATSSCVLPPRLLPFFLHTHCFACIACACASCIQNM